MPPTVDRIYTVARDILDTLTAGYATANADLPARQLVTPGLPSWDCEGVYVQVERVYTHDGNVAGEILQAATDHPGHALTGCVVAVSILRCVPTLEDGPRPKIPPAAAEEAAAELILTDAQRSWNILLAAQRAGEIAGCNGLAYDSWTSDGPAGGIAGGVLRLRVGVGR